MERTLRGCQKLGRGRRLRRRMVPKVRRGWRKEGFEIGTTRKRKGQGDRGVAQCKGRIRKGGKGGGRSDARGAREEGEGY